MGLDMYLSKRRYVKNWDHDTSNKWQITVKNKDQEVTSKLPVKEIVYEAAYWRKANAIHNWFVQNVQDGEDNCAEYWVSGEQLQSLVDICKTILATAKLGKGKIQNGSTMVNGEWQPIMEDGVTVTNPDEIRELLPPTSGFFFGSTDIDQYFIEDIKDTVKQLELALAEEGGDYYYQSSW